MAKIQLKLDEKLSNEYYQTEEDGHYPISEVDVEILSIIKEAIITKGALRDGTFANIFSSYKTNLPDEQVLRDLKKWSDWYDDNPDAEWDMASGSLAGEVDDAIKKAKELVKKDMVEVKEELYLISSIKRVSKRRFNLIGQGLTPYIVFNESPVEGSGNNIKIRCKSIQEQDQIFEDLKEKLEKFINIVFIA